MYALISIFLQSAKIIICLLKRPEIDDKTLTYIDMPLQDRRIFQESHLTKIISKIRVQVSGQKVYRATWSTGRNDHPDKLRSLPPVERQKKKKERERSEARKVGADPNGGSVILSRPRTVYGSLKREASAASLKSLVAQRRWDGEVTWGVIRTLYLTAAGDPKRNPIRLLSQGTLASSLLSVVLSSLLRRREECRKNGDRMDRFMDQTSEEEGCRRRKETPLGLYRGKP